MSEQRVWSGVEISRRGFLTGLGLATVLGLSACKAGDFFADTEPDLTFNFDVRKDKRKLALNGIADKNLLESTLVLPDPDHPNSYVTPRRLALRIAARRRDTTYAAAQFIDEIRSGKAKLPSGLTYLGMNDNTSSGKQFGIVKTTTIPVANRKRATKTFQITAFTAGSGEYPLEDIISAGQKDPITDWSEFDGDDNLLMMSCIERGGTGPATWESTGFSDYFSDSNIIPGWPGKQEYPEGAATEIDTLLAMNKRERMLADFILSGLTPDTATLASQ